MNAIFNFLVNFADKLLEILTKSSDIMAKVIEILKSLIVIME